MCDVNEETKHVKIDLDNDDEDEDNDNDGPKKGKKNKRAKEEPEEEEELSPEETMVVAEDEADIVATRTSNSYAAKKTVAQGMMDIALITSNANQLRYLMEYASETKTYYLNLVLISISLLLQVAVGVSLLFKGRYQLRGDPKHKNVSKINNFSVIGVFLVTLINVFIASFTMSEKQEAPKPVLNPVVMYPST
ncbi:ninjurin-1-like [Coccinella septempunctata]|uniref:ninjurin-1-like n=1 Tax=Coccinella septempunctata TaxID=41139 RepID=UPI001D08266B|nr:ninjurin-1-like [Coccinella septempunctata]